MYDESAEPVYVGSSITKAQCLLLILSFVLRHGLTAEALKDLLVLMNLLLPNAVPSTKHKFYKKIKMESYEVI